MTIKGRKNLLECQQMEEIILDGNEGIVIFFNGNEGIFSLLYQYGAPSGSYLKPVESSKSITSSGYELRQGLIQLVQQHTFF
jgi:hypothetical protein